MAKPNDGIVSQNNDWSCYKVENDERDGRKVKSSSKRSFWQKELFV